MNAKKMKIRKDKDEFHEFYNTLNVVLISKKEIIVSCEKYLTFYIDMNKSNEIQLDDYINDMIYLPDKSIILSLKSNIQFLKKVKNKYEVYKTVNINSIFLLNNENILYAFDNNSLKLIDIKNYSIISSISLNKNKDINQEMKPFFLPEKNNYNICIRKDYNLYLLDAKTYKEINELSFNAYIDFTVDQKEKEKDKFYVCIYKDWEKKENKMDIEIREYNNKFQVIHKYNKILYTPPLEDSLYPIHLCIHKLLIINNKFYIFMHAYAEFRRENFHNHYLLDFESNKLKTIFTEDEDLYYKFLFCDNKLLFAYFYYYDYRHSKDTGIRIIDYENMDYDLEDDYDNDDSYEEGKKSEISDNDLEEDNDSKNKANSDDEEEQEGKNDDYDSEENICKEVEDNKKKKNKNKKTNKKFEKLLDKKTKRKSK